ncbi:MurR/RpiR family transcriptional regulator [Sinobaca sp. H24]|uniref:MurR/RpiR family transcriptional regulator n=1 Tax=Sinobaca sp. H24 TaxID=2923376 RepID=UPI002079B9DE|nr:MurR/RpiR family transcriptional regulator [Sinobaca sp. H24]
MYNFLAKLLNFIESSTDHTKSEVIIAEYILRNVQYIPDMSIYELAEACHTSPATITRFCHRFENISYKELKEYARTFIEFNHTEVAFENIESQVSMDQIANYYDELQQALEETRHMFQSKDVLEVVKIIHASQKISFFGVTFSHLLARNAQFKFIRLGKTALAYSNHENQLTEAENVTSRDAAIVISFSGETRFIVRLVKELKKRNVPIIAITSSYTSTLGRHAKHVIPVSEKTLEHYKSPILEEITMLSAINSIYLMYSSFLHANRSRN